MSDDLRSRIAAAIREEAACYPEDQDGVERCLDDEAECIAANIHMSWSQGGVIREVMASPDRLAAVAVQQVAVWLRSTQAINTTIGAVCARQPDLDRSRWTVGDILLGAADSLNGGSDE